MLAVVIRGTLQVPHVSKCIPHWCVFAKMFRSYEIDPAVLHWMSSHSLTSASKWAGRIRAPAPVWLFTRVHVFESQTIHKVDILIIRQTGHAVNSLECSNAGVSATSGTAAAKGHRFKYASSHWGAWHPTVNPADWGLSQRLKGRVELHCRRSR